MSAMIQAEGVWKHFGPQTVLKDVTLQVAQGEVLCIIGPSGAGKSTFLRCVNHLETIDDGRLFVDGELMGYHERNEVMHEMRPRDVNVQRAKIGMVFQNFNLYPHMTALQNVSLAPVVVHKRPRKEADQRSHELLARVGLSHKTDRYPRHLSGGEQQRVAIARALAIQPKLILFDEPTSALDPELVGEVLAVIRDVAETGMTLLVVTHEIGFAREVGDHVAFMDGGAVVEYGPPREVLDSPREARTREFLEKVL
jgi:polar amino acid transport system ATP-binding protein